MQLPGAREGQIAGLQMKVLAVDAEAERAAFEKRQFDAFVAMPIESPVLPVVGVPKADHLHARQRGAGQADGRDSVRGPRLTCRSWPRCDRLDDRPARVGLVGLSLLLVDGDQRTLPHGEVDRFCRAASDAGGHDGGWDKCLIGFAEAYSNDDASARLLHL